MSLEIASAMNGQTQAGDRPGTAMASIILRGERDTIFVLDLQTHEYLTYQTDSRGAVAGSRPAPAAQSGGTLRIDIDYVDTGERKELFGHIARHIITKEKRVASPGACSRDSYSETDGWYLDSAIPLPEWRQPKKNAFGVVVASVGSFGTDGKCADRMDKIEAPPNWSRARIPHQAQYHAEKCSVAAAMDHRGCWTQIGDQKWWS